MKIFKSIISLLLVFALVFTNVRLDFPVVTEYNETVAVDETVQLRIPGGATKVEWETSSKRIAKISYDGKVTGVKAGTCDINCRAEYSKFVFFKDVVNYVFHITVVESQNNNSLKTPEIKFDSDTLFAYKEDNNSHYKMGVSESFTFDIYTENSADSSYEIKDANKRIVNTKTKNANTANVYTVMPVDKYEQLTTYVVSLKNGARFVDEEYENCTTLIFTTTGEAKYNVKYNDKVIKDLITLQSDNVIKKTENGKEVYEIQNIDAAKYNVGQILVTEDNVTKKKMAYKIISKDNNKIVAEKPKLNEIYDELDVHTNGSLKLGLEDIKKDKKLMKAIKDRVLELFIQNAYASGYNTNVALGNNVDVSFSEKSDGTMVIKVAIDAKKIAENISGKIIFDTSFKIEHDFIFNILAIENTALEVRLNNLETNLSFIAEGNWGSSIDDSSDLINGSAESEELSYNVFSRSFDLVDVLSGGLTMEARNELENSTGHNWGLIGVAIDIDIVNYLMASISINLSGKYTASFRSGVSAMKGAYAYQSVKSKFSINLTVVGKIRDTVQLPCVKLYIYAITDMFFNIGVEVSPQIDLVAAGKYKFESSNITNAGNNSSFSGYLSVSADLKIKGTLYIDLYFTKINPEIEFVSIHLFNKSFGDLIDIYIEPNESEMNSEEKYVAVGSIHKVLIDMDSDWLDTKEEIVSPDDNNLKYYLDSSKTKRLLYTNGKGVHIPYPPGENFDIFVEYTGQFNTKFDAVCHVTTTMLPTTTMAQTTMPMTTVPPTIAPPETTVASMTGNSKIEGMVQAIIPGTNETQVVTNAEVRFYNSNNPTQLVGSIYTDTMGKFSSNLPAGSYKLVTSAPGYVTLESTETLADYETKYVEIYILFSENETGKGSAAGKVINAVTGDAIEGVRIGLRAGWNKNGGEYAITKTFQTNSSGNYNIKDVDVGYYTLEFVKEGFVNEYKNILILHSKPITDYNTALNPILTGEGDLRIVLKWGLNPRDLDSHLIGKKPNDTYFDVYFHAKKYDYENIEMANLDLDDRDSYGPETITITNKIFGNYVYGVHDFSNGGSTNSKALSNSNCNVTIYVGDTAIKKFNVPTNRVGTFWEVFSIDENYQITAINKIYNYSPLNNDFSRFAIESGDWDGGSDYEGISVGIGDNNNIVIGNNSEDNIESISKTYAISSTENVSYTYEDVNSTVRIKIIKPRINGYNYQVINENMDDVIEDIKAKVEEYINENEDKIKSITFKAPYLEVSSGNDIEMRFVADVKNKDSSTGQIKYSLKYNVIDDTWQVDMFE